MARSLYKIGMMPFLFAVVSIPLSNQAKWTSLKFNRIPPNKVEFSSDVNHPLTIRVDRSGSPLIYRLDQPLKIQSFAVDLEFTGNMNQEEQQGSPNQPAQWPEDAYLRVGLVVPGTRRLSAWERLFAANWIKEMFKLAPQEQGLDKVYFFSLVARAPKALPSRILPGSKSLIEEKVIAERGANESQMHLHHTLTPPLDAIAIWLSSDGDNSHSKFSVTLKNLTLNVQ